MSGSFQPSHEQLSQSFGNTGGYRKKRSLADKMFWVLSLLLIGGYSLWHFDLLPVEIGLAPSGELTARSSETSQDQAIFDPQAEPITPLAVFQAQVEPGQGVVAEPLEAESKLRNLTSNQNNPFLSTNGTVKNDRVVTPAANEQPELLVHQTASLLKKPTEIRTLGYNKNRNPVNWIQKPHRNGTSNIQPVSGSSAQSIQASSVSENLTPHEEIQRHRALSKTYWENSVERAKILPDLQKLSRKIYFSPTTNYMAPYTVKPGEQLRTIAQNYNVPWEYLARLNRVTPEKLRAGRALKVIRGPFSAVVDLSDYQVTVHAHGYFVAQFPIGTGKDHSTPVGKFPVKNKEVNPTYYGPDGVIAREDPANPLGERWIDLGDSYGVHGTIDPTSIGKSESRGCIRLHNQDVEILFDLLTVGSEVVIRE